jgi:hypothetical protein
VCRFPFLPSLSLVTSRLPTSRLSHFPRLPPIGHPMSHPAICIAPQGTTPHVRPRYIPCDLAGIIPKSVSGSCGLMVRYSKIPHTPYGIRNSGIRNANTPIPHHGAGLSWPIIRGCEWRRQNGAVSALPFPAPRTPLSQFDAEAPLRRLLDPFPLQRGAFASIHRTRYFAISRRVPKNRSRSVGAFKAPESVAAFAVFNSLVEGV